MRETIRRNGGKSIVIGRFATGVAGTVPFAAGASDIDPKTFFIYTVMFRRLRERRRDA